MPVHNVEIAATLNKLADLLEIDGANVYRVRAYRNASQTVAGLSRSIADMVASGEDLMTLPGIGEALAAKLKEIVETGHLTALQKEEQRLPASLLDLLKMPALGPKRVRLLHEKLGITDRETLSRAIRSGKLRELPGFGEKTEKKLVEVLGEKHEAAERMLLSVAEALVQALVSHLRQVPGVTHVEPAGSFRRRVETVGDIDLLAVCDKPLPVMSAFVGHEDVVQVLSKGDTRSSVVLRPGLHADLRVVPAASYGAALHYFTGSKKHNIAIRTRGVKKRLKINEYGIFRGKKQIGGATEQEVFESVGLPYIEPELREDRGEIEAAERGQLPALIRPQDIRGDLQSHTDATDGRDTLEQMAHAAQARGYDYLAITDHSKHVAMAHGLNATRLARQLRQIDRLNETLKPFRLLKSSEVDILEDGSLDLSDDILRDLDFVVVAIHYRFNMARERQTERIIRAMDNPNVNILVHPTGRLINERAPIELDMERLMKAAKERGCALEVNAQPVRLDLTDADCRRAKGLGLKVAISTDAHSVSDLNFMKYGVNQARRGWLEAADVVNTRSCGDLLKLLKRR